MNDQALIIRPEKQTDYMAIEKVNDAAFQQPNEGQMVNKLRAVSDYIKELSIIAEVENTVVGHILFYPVVIKGPAGKYKVLSLAPMAVLPAYQRKGIGSTLIRTGLKQAKIMGYEAVVVLGHPDYYPRFGFQKASHWDIRPPIKNIPDEAFMAIELIPGSLLGKKGEVEFPEAYYEAL